MSHWLWLFWLAVWPNLAASVIWTVPALAWHHRRIHARIDRLAAEGVAKGRHRLAQPRKGDALDHDHGEQDDKQVTA